MVINTEEISDEDVVLAPAQDPPPPSSDVASGLPKSEPLADSASPADLLLCDPQRLRDTEVLTFGKHTGRTFAEVLR